MKLVCLAASLTIVQLLPLSGASHQPLLPQPQKIRYGSGRLALAGLSIRLASNPAAEDRFAATTLSSALRARAGIDLPIAAAGPAARAIVLKRVNSAFTPPDVDERLRTQSYQVSVNSTGAEIRAPSSEGLFYGVQTLAQLVETDGVPALPFVEIEDWPSFPYRGFMMDTSHGPMPTEEEIKRQLDFLARWKLNQYYFYSEFSIELKGYTLINPGARYTQDQVRRIVAYAKDRHIDVVPCLELYGHTHDLLRLERYADLAPLPHGGEFNPQNPRVAGLLADWVKQMTDLFPSRFFHIGLDETWELEKVAVERAGGIEPGKLYIQQFLTVARLVRDHGRVVMLWADILKRYPNLIPDLPPGTIAVPWEYNPKPDYNYYVEPFAKAKVPIVVATGIWIWNHIIPEFDKTFDNIDSFVATGRKYGAAGVLNTGWTDDGQTLYRTALPAMAYGAVASWQSVPVDRKRFFADYATQFYPAAVAAELGPALTALDEAHRHLSNALNGESMHRLWEDPFRPAMLKRCAARMGDLRQGRLRAEDAQEHLDRALQLKADPYSISSLWLGARMLDYLGMKYMYAVEIAGFFDKLGGNPRPDMARLLLWTEASAQDHSFVADLMDALSELRGLYREAWLAESNSYRLAVALARWDAEMNYWRQVQVRLQSIVTNYKAGDTLPPVESIRPDH